MEEVTQRRWIGQVEAETLTELAGDGSTITVSWGSTLQFMDDSLTGDSGRNGMRIVALMGVCKRPAVARIPAMLPNNSGNISALRRLRFVRGLCS